jgi:hypothetical protein
MSMSMSMAGDLARFLTRASVDDLPPLAVERANGDRQRGASPSRKSALAPGLLP